MEAAIGFFQKFSPTDLHYLKHLLKEPILEKDEEQALTYAWFFEGDEKALHQLIKAYTRLVVSISLKYKHYGLPLPDLIQEGYLGLMQAADRFDPTRDIRFSSYAKWWVRACIQDYILRNWSIVRAGSTTAQKQLFFHLRRLRSQLTSVSHEIMNHEEKNKIAEILKVTLSDVENMEARLACHDLSLSRPVFESGEEEWQDFIEDSGQTPEGNAIESDEDVLREQWIQQAMDLLNSREKTIIQERRLNENPMTLDDLGKHMQISKERVRQLEARAIRKMRVHLVSTLQDVKDFMK